MQKKIFEDQAVMHEAYLAGGVAPDRGASPRPDHRHGHAEAWRQIDAGRRDPASDTVADGNRTLLFREQHDIIGPVLRPYACLPVAAWPDVHLPA